MTTLKKENELDSYFIWTIGCQMNKADSDRLESALIQLGMGPVKKAKDADVIVLNSCVVRQAAEDKVTGMLSSLKSVKRDADDKIIALMGCMVGPKTAELESRFPHVDAFMQPQNYRPLLELLGERMGLDAEGCLTTLTPPNVAVTAYVPIIHGCDKFCSFCIIPYRRGREVSRTIVDIVNEVELLAARNVKEITLLGQNVDSYGHDLSGKVDLADLLTAVDRIDGLERIRFLTSHPNDMSQKIIDAVASLEKVCEHFNLPFQAGDDEVLKVMRRGYTNAEYRSKVELIRDTVPGVSMSTDLIVGFPGESEEAFQESVKLLEDVKFDKVHVAAYSERPGTIASRKLPDTLSYDEKKLRLSTVEQIQERIVGKINERLLGETVEVLVEGHSKGKWKGRNRNDKLVFFEDDRLLQGKVVNVHIDKTSPWSMQGTALS